MSGLTDVLVAIDSQNIPVVISGREQLLLGPAI